MRRVAAMLICTGLLFSTADGESSRSVTAEETIKLTASGQNEDVMDSAWLVTAEEAETPIVTEIARLDAAGRRLPTDFSAGPELNPDHYRSDTLYEDSSIRVAIETGRQEECDYWVADIEIADASQLRTSSASGDFTKPGAIRDGIRMAKAVNAVVALDGDSWNAKQRHELGIEIRQGRILKYKVKNPQIKQKVVFDVLLTDENGDFHILRHPIGEDSLPMHINGKQIINAFTFGPVLVENGEAVTDFQGTDAWMDMATDWPKQRICICQAGSLHYKIITCAGRWHGSEGMTMAQFARLAANQGVQIAYNLDGGDSTMLYFRGEKINSRMNKIRKLWDIIYFASLEGV